MYKEGMNAYIKGGLLRLIIMVWRVSPRIVNNQKGKRKVELELISRNFSLTIIFYPSRSKFEVFIITL